MTRKEKISAFFKQSELFDYMVTRPLSHIVPNWELTWNLKENRVTYSGAYPFTFRQPIKHKNSL